MSKTSFSDYSSRQAQMDREYLEAGGDAPNHQKQYPQTFRGTVEDVVEPDVYGHPDEPTGNADRAEVLRKICEVLEDGRPSTMAARLAALKYHWRMNDLSLREAAKKAGCGVVTLLDAKRKIENAFLRGKS